MKIVSANLQNYDFNLLIVIEREDGTICAVDLPYDVIKKVKPRHTLNLGGTENYYDWHEED